MFSSLFVVPNFARTCGDSPITKIRVLRFLRQNEASQMLSAIKTCPLQLIKYEPLTIGIHLRYVQSGQLHNSQRFEKEKGPSNSNCRAVYFDNDCFAKALLQTFWKLLYEKKRICLLQGSYIFLLYTLLIREEKSGLRFWKCLINSVSSFFAQSRFWNYLSSANKATSRAKKNLGIELSLKCTDDFDTRAGKAFMQKDILKTQKTNVGSCV